MSPLGLRTTSCVGRIFISTIFSALWPFIYFTHLSYKNIYYFLGPLCWMPTRKSRAQCIGATRSCDTVYASPTGCI